MKISHWFCTGFDQDCSNKDFHDNKITIDKGLSGTAPVSCWRENVLLTTSATSACVHGHASHSPYAVTYQSEADWVLTKRLMARDPFTMTNPPAPPPPAPDSPRASESPAPEGPHGELEMELVGLANALYNLGTTVVSDLTKEKDKPGGGKQVGARV